MNREEALKAVAAVVNRSIGRSYADLVRLIGKPETFKIMGAAGVTYQVELNAMWDGDPGHLLRVSFAVDDGGMRGLIPITVAGLVAPEAVFDGDVG